MRKRWFAALLAMPAALSAAESAPEGRYAEMARECEMAAQPAARCAVVRFDDEHGLLLNIDLSREFSSGAHQREEVYASVRDMMARFAALDGDWVRVQTVTLNRPAMERYCDPAPGGKWFDCGDWSEVQELSYVRYWRRFD